MRLQVLIPLLLGLVALPGLVTAIVIAATIGRSASVGAADLQSINLTLSLGFAGVAAATLGAWLLLHRLVFSPLQHLSREARSLSITPQDRPPSVPRPALIANVVAGVGELSRALARTKVETDAKVLEATSAAAEQKQRLEAILLDLAEGVIVCNLEHRIILYNEAARRMLGLREVTGLGRPLFAILTREPILHSMQILMRRGEQAEPERSARRFMVSTVDFGTLIETRMNLVREANKGVTGYVLSFQDIGAQVESLTVRDQLLREVMVDWRRPIANLSAAIETFTSADDLTASERAGFEDILRKEIGYLLGRFNDAAKRIDRLDAGPWGFADVYSADLFRAAERVVAEERDLKLSHVGLPGWIAADSHSLALTVAHLVKHLHAETGRNEFDLGVSQSKSFIYLDIGWVGEAIRSDTLDTWLDEPIKGTLANRTARQVIERHGGELWSTEAPNGGALLRLPLRPAEMPEFSKDSDSIAPRPEYYDFDLFRTSPPSLADAKLRELRYVVFDTETTGLMASQGDELLSIGAVHVVNGRLLTSETFERLIDPGRDIPPLSTSIHGITEPMVRGKPPARIVLPQFRKFAGDSVLVAYNIAFDMKFLTKRQQEAGVVFDNPVLDALLLAVHLFPDHPDPSLSSMARFFDIEVTGRHTALGDAMMTAAVWLRLIEGLEQKGVTTFGEAVTISDRMLAQRRLGDKF